MLALVGETAIGSAKVASIQRRLHLVMDSRQPVTSMEQLEPLLSALDDLDEWIRDLQQEYPHQRKNKTFTEYVVGAIPRLVCGVQAIVSQFLYLQQFFDPGCTSQSPLPPIPAELQRPAGHRQDPAHPDWRFGIL